MVKVKALGVAVKECGFALKEIMADDIDSLLSLLPKGVAEMKNRGELVILVNGTEISSLQDGYRFSNDDIIVLLPVVHGG